MFKRGFLIFAGLLAALLIFELYLRIFPPKEFSRLIDEKELYVPDPVLRYTLRPNFSHYVGGEGPGSYLFLNE